MSIAQVISSSPVILPEKAQVRREPLHPPHGQDPNHLEAFDSRTVWYDAFRHNGDIVLSGPPLFNLRQSVQAARIRVDGAVVDPTNIRLSDIDRTQRSRIRRMVGDRLRIEGVAAEDLTADIGADGRGLFEGHRVVVTLTAGGGRCRPDEWLAYYMRAHDVTAALVYVTDPTKTSDVLDQLANLDVPVAVAVSWPFPGAREYGPRDSDFSYYSALEHARQRFLERADGVLNVGVDQLVVTDDGRSIFDLATAAPRGLTRFDAFMIEPATTAKNRERPSFHDYRHHRGARARPRWALVPDKAVGDLQWRVHTVGGVRAPISVRARARQFAALGAGADTDRVIVPDADQPDRAMSAALDTFLPRSRSTGTIRRPRPRRTGRQDRRSIVQDRLGQLARLARGRPVVGRLPLLRDPEYDYLFIMTYGRSGSTLLQGILSSIPGYLIRGENDAMMYSLFTFHNTAVRQRERLASPRVIPSTHPFYGIDRYPDERAFSDLRHLALDTVLRPMHDTRVVGFKEIRWAQRDLIDYLGFLRQVFPGARFVVNTRDVDQVMRSKWWARSSEPRKRVLAAERKILDGAEALGDAAYHVHYNDYVRDPEALRGLYTWLGEPFDLATVQRAMRRRYSY